MSDTRFGRRLNVLAGLLAMSVPPEFIGCRVIQKERASERRKRRKHDELRAARKAKRQARKRSQK